jgi:hypothetical protein
VRLSPFPLDKVSGGGLTPGRPQRGLGRVNFKRIICGLAALALSGCISMKAAPVSESALAPYQGQKLTIVTYQKPDFFAMTQTLALSTGLFGALGGIAAASIATDNGNKLVNDDAIPDPTLAVSARLAPQLRELLKPSSEMTFPGLDQKFTDEAALAKVAGNQGIIFEVQTVNWGFIYFPFSTHYRATFAMRARLIDANTGKRIAQAPCAFASDEEGAPTYDEMVADQGGRLKALLSTGTDTCFSTIQKSLVN